MGLNPCVSHTPVLCQSGFTYDHSANGRRQTRNSGSLVPKIIAKFERDHPIRDCQMQMGYAKIGQFLQILYLVIS